MKITQELQVRMRIKADERSLRKHLTIVLENVAEQGLQCIQKALSRQAKLWEQETNWCSTLPSRQVEFVQMDDLLRCCSSSGEAYETPSAPLMLNVFPESFVDAGTQNDSNPCNCCHCRQFVEVSSTELIPSKACASTMAWNTDTSNEISMSWHQAPAAEEFAKLICYDADGNTVYWTFNFTAVILEIAENRAAVIKKTTEQVRWIVKAAAAPCFETLKNRAIDPKELTYQALPAVCSAVDNTARPSDKHSKKLKQQVPKELAKETRSVSDTKFDYSTSPSLRKSRDKKISLLSVKVVVPGASGTHKLAFEGHLEAVHVATAVENLNYEETFNAVAPAKPATQELTVKAIEVNHEADVSTITAKCAIYEAPTEACENKLETAQTEGDAVFAESAKEGALIEAAVQDISTAGARRYKKVKAAREFPSFVRICGMVASPDNVTENKNKRISSMGSKNRNLHKNDNGAPIEHISFWTHEQYLAAVLYNNRNAAIKMPNNKTKLLSIFEDLTEESAVELEQRCIDFENVILKVEQKCSEVCAKSSDAADIKMCTAIHNFIQQHKFKKLVRPTAAFSRAKKSNRKAKK